MAIEPKALVVSNKPSRFNLTYAFELVAVGGSGIYASAGGGANRVVNLPLNPTAYSVMARAAAAVTPTAGGVSAEESGFILRDCVVSGHCGLKTKRGWSAGTATNAGGLVEADGNTLWRELRNLFTLYGKFKADPTAAPAKYLMAWHDFQRDDHWIIVPKSFDSVRDAQQHRVHLPYSISFTAVADYDKTAKGIFDDGIVADVLGALAKVKQAINEVQGYVEDAQAFVDKVDSVISGVILGTIGAVSSLLGAAQGFKDSVTNLINLPQRIAAAIRGLVDQWHQLMGERSGTWSPTSRSGTQVVAQLEVAARMAESLDAMISVPDVWSTRSWQTISTDRQALVAGEGRLSAVELAAVAAAGAPGGADAQEAVSLTARATAGSASRRQGVPPRTSPQRPIYTGQRAYVVRGGDTVLGIAVRELADPDAWIDIVEANRLRPPYITPLRPPGTVWIGDTLLLPTNGDQPDATPSRGPALDAAADEALLGVDFALDETGEWLIDTDGGAVDVLDVRGVACYEAALDCRFRTLLGTNLIAPQVGILAPIGQQNGQGVPDAIALSVRTAALQDPRTVDVDKLTFVDGGDTVSVELTAYAKGHRGGRVVRRVLE